MPQQSLPATTPPVVSPQEWEAARQELLVKEKELTRAHDATFARVSRAPQADIERLKARMGWSGPWYTITDGFDADFGVDEWHGTNVFIRDGERIFRTYFLNGRGDEALGSTWSYLDLTPLGRQEDWEDSPDGYPQTRAYEWWRRHDDYGSEADPWDGRLDEK